MGVLDKLDAASTARRKVSLILDAALEAEWRDLKDQLDQAATADVDTGSLAMPATTKVVNAMEAIRERVAASEVTFHFESVDWRERVRLQAEHPPRKDNRVDAFRGYDVEAFTPAIIRKTCVGVTDNEGDEPTPIPDETWDRLLGTDGAKPQLSLGQIDLLYAATTEVNEGLAAVPRSARFLLGSQASEASLAQPTPGTSPRSASKAGSRPTSRKSSATKKAASRAS